VNSPPFEKIWYAKSQERLRNASIDIHEVGTTKKMDVFNRKPGTCFMARVVVEAKMMTSPSRAEIFFCLLHKRRRQFRIWKNFGFFCTRGTNGAPYALLEGR
jgi:hypothetical protein